MIDISTKFTAVEEPHPIQFDEALTRWSCAVGFGPAGITVGQGDVVEPRGEVLARQRKFLAAQRSPRQAAFSFMQLLGHTEQAPPARPTGVIRGAQQTLARNEQLTPANAPCDT